MLLSESTNVVEMVKYLREKYSLGCLIKNRPKPNYLNTHKKNKAELIIHGDVILNDFFRFLKDYNIDAYFINNKGHQLPKNILLKDIEKYYPEEKETNEVFKSLKVVESMIGTDIYTDIDWIIRIYKRIINVASTEEEKSKILESITKLNDSNERFTDRDSTQLINSIKRLDR